jgi:hypothetical protein
MADDFQSCLLGLSKEVYGSEYNSHLLAQYELYVEMADRVSERRQAANTYFLTINTALVAMLGIAWSSAIGVLMSTWFIVVGVGGMILCYSWYRLLRSYRDLNSGKFKVIHAIESCLPLRPYDAEWARLGRGRDSKLYLPFTGIETKVPWVFFFLYMVIIVINPGKPPALLGDSQSLTFAGA